MFSQLLANYPMLFPLALMFSIVILASLVLLVTNREKMESFYEERKPDPSQPFEYVVMQDYATWDAALCMSMYSPRATSAIPRSSLKPLAMPFIKMYPHIKCN